ncbi:phosphatase PAP2 family protein [Methanobacterium sp. ACI-7]|uniref:phosphatase PAP2 family protein n=1 Tax=unclassified Methanobacterium TaxID=2627676 RepID=UPI0039C49257
MDLMNLIIFDLINPILNYNVMLFYLVNNGLENSILNIIMPFLTDFGSLAAWCIICALLYIFGGVKAKKVAILAFLALFISNVFVYLLKHFIAEPRPFLVLGNVHQLVLENDVYSFPSGHATSSFAAAVVIGLKYSIEFLDRKIRIIYPIIAFAAVIGFSRIYIGVHYPLDVVFGALIGTICALLVLKFENKIFLNKISNLIGLQKILNLNFPVKFKNIINKR